MPEMLERLQVAYQIKEGENEYLDYRLNDICNDAYGLMYAVSVFFGPIIGGEMYVRFGSSKTCEILSIVDFIFGFIILYYNCGFDVFEENRQFQEKLKML